MCIPVLIIHNAMIFSGNKNNSKNKNQKWLNKKTSTVGSLQQYTVYPHIFNKSVQTKYKIHKVIANGGDYAVSTL